MTTKVQITVGTFLSQLFAWTYIQFFVFIVFVCACKDVLHLMGFSGLVHDRKKFLLREKIYCKLDVG